MTLGRSAAKWLALSAGVAMLAGTASALFLFLLDWATTTRTMHRWLLAGLPLAGLLVGLLYWRYGRSVETGNNLLIDEIHAPSRPIPFRMAPMVLFGTVISHLFGASVGREGTAVQMGGALADQLAQRFRLSRRSRRWVLMTGISAGFASVFGTPIAATVFAMEVLVVRRPRIEALLPCLLAAWLADRVGLLWGVVHAHYPVAPALRITLGALLAIAIAGVAFGLAARLFARTTHWLGQLVQRGIRFAPLRPFIGGAVIALIAGTLGADRYLGLGLAVIAESFEHAVPAQDFAAKLALTAASLASGFKGGEVTPLFFIGSTLGSTLAPLLDLPVALLAGIGFVAVFGGAANTPLAATLMAIELFGLDIGLYAAIGCLCSYLASGPAGIYRAQRVAHPVRLRRSRT